MPGLVNQDALSYPEAKHPLQLCYPLQACDMRPEANKTDPFSGETVEIKCPGNLVMTVSQGAVSKYDALMRDIIQIYGCDAYISQLYSSVSMWVAQTFEDRSVGSQQRLW